MGLGQDGGGAAGVVRVSVLPRGCDRQGSSGTWMASAFYCEPATVWHSRASECGTTEGIEERSEEGSEERRPSSKVEQIRVCIKVRSIWKRKCSVIL